jgi:hypothetical protein
VIRKRFCGRMRREFLSKEKKPFRSHLEINLKGGGLAGIYIPLYIYTNRVGGYNGFKSNFLY